MKVTLLYVTVTNGPKTEDLAGRFSATLHAYPAEYPFDLLVCCNGGPPSTVTGLVLDMYKPKFFLRENHPSWDIGAFITAAGGPAAEADMVVCLGESVYFHRSGWLKRVVDCWRKYGAGMYGFYSSNLVRPHMNTTAFATHPALLRDYPHPIHTHHDRYEFEHGQHAFWRYVRSRGMPTKLITWDGEYDPFLWRYPKDILWRGDQTNLLAWCNHTDRYVDAAPEVRAQWARGADSPPQEALR